MCAQCTCTIVFADVVICISWNLFNFGLCSFVTLSQYHDVILSQYRFVFFISILSHYYLIIWLLSYLLSFYFYEISSSYLICHHLIIILSYYLIILLLSGMLSTLSICYKVDMGLGIVVGVAITKAIHIARWIRNVVQNTQLKALGNTKLIGQGI